MPPPFPSPFWLAPCAFAIDDEHQRANASCKDEGRYNAMYKVQVRKHTDVVRPPTLATVFTSIDWTTFCHKWETWTGPLHRGHSDSWPFAWHCCTCGLQVAVVQTKMALGYTLPSRLLIFRCNVGEISLCEDLSSLPWSQFWRTSPLHAPLQPSSGQEMHSSTRPPMLRRGSNDAKRNGLRINTTALFGEELCYTSTPDNTCLGAGLHRRGHRILVAKRLKVANKLPTLCIRLVAK